MITYSEPSWATCPLLKDFDTIMALQGEVFREQDGRRTLYFQWQQQGCFAKLHHGVGWREILKNWLQGKRPIVSAQNEWRAIQRCHRQGIPTMDLVAYGVQGRNPASRKSFLITRALTPVVSLADYCAHWKTQAPPSAHRRALIIQVAHLARQFHDARMNHRDFYLCHFLLDKDKSHGHHFVLYLIDLHRALIHTSAVPKRWLVKDLAGLLFSSMDMGFTQRDWLRFVKAYERCSWHALSSKKKCFWKQVLTKGLRLYHRLAPMDLNASKTAEELA